MDTILILTIVTIFLAAFVGTVVRYRVRDKCLRGFEGYFTTAEFKDGKSVWGELKVYHNSLEFIYTAPYLDPDGSHYETSYMIYQDQYPNLLLLRRLHDELTPARQQRRSIEIQRTYHPNATRRFLRSLRNFFNLMRDAVSQALSTILAQSKRGPAGNLLATQEGRLNQTAQTIITAAAASYEPMLEKYIGRKVVLELPRNNKAVEYCGILKDYTNAFVAVLDVPVEDEQEVNLANPSQMEANRYLDFTLSPATPGIEDGRLLKASVSVKVHNKGHGSVEISHADGEGYSQRLDLTIPVGSTTEFLLDGIPVPPTDGPPPPEGTDSATVPPHNSDVLQLPPIRLSIKARRYMDLVAPRPLGVIRHGAETISRGLRLLGIEPTTFSPPATLS